MGVARHSEEAIAASYRRAYAEPGAEHDELTARSYDQGPTAIAEVQIVRDEGLQHAGAASGDNCPGTSHVGTAITSTPC